MEQHDYDQMMRNRRKAKDAEHDRLRERRGRSYPSKERQREQQQQERAARKAREEQQIQEFFTQQRAVRVAVSRQPAAAASSSPLPIPIPPAAPAEFCPICLDDILHAGDVHTSACCRHPLSFHASCWESLRNDCLLNRIPFCCPGCRTVHVDIVES